MEPARALADLVEISPQIAVAAVLAADGDPAGVIGVPASRASVLAGAVRELLDKAAEFRTDGRVTQLHAELAEDDVFAVVDAGGTAIVAVTNERGAPGLVFYDLKQCLARLADEA